MADYKWASGIAGDWDNAGNWVPAIVPDGASSDVTITSGDATIVSGTSFVVDSITLTSGAASLDVQGFLDMGGSGVLSVGAGALTLASGGTIENGTIVTGTQTLQSSSGVLSNDVIVGPLDIAASTELLVLNTLTVETAAGHLPGTINIGDNAVLDAENIVTLDHAVINLGAAGGGAVLEHDQRGSGGTLALGSGVTLNVIGTGDSIIEDGGSTIANHGTIDVTAGAQVQIFGGAQFINTGEIDIGAGGVLTESTPFLNTGTLHVNGGTLNLNGAVSGALLQDISMSATGVVDVQGAVDLGGGTLTLPSIGTLEVGNGGTIENGTIVTGTATLHSSSGVLSNDVIVGPLDIAASTELLVLNTLTVETAAGHLPGTINIGDNAVLDAENIVTLDHAVINLGAAGGGAVLEHDQRGSGGTLALGSGVTLNVIGTGDSIIEDGGSTIANHGTIDVTAGAQVQIFGGAQFINTGEIDIGAGGVLTESTPFLNTGTLHVNGGTLNLNGAVSGALLQDISMSATGVVDVQGAVDLGGGTLTLPSIGTLEVGNGGTIENGTIVTGTATLHSSSGVLSNDVIVGPLDIAASTELLVLNTLTVETAAGHLPGTINIGDNAVLDAENIVTLDHAVINLGAAGGGAVLEHDQRGSGGTLALGSGVTLNVIGTGDSIIEDGGSTIANHGTIDVTAGAQVQIFGGAQFINTGEIDIGAGGVLTESTPFLNTGTLHVNGGTLNLNGAVSGALLQDISMSATGVVDVQGAVDLGGGTLTLPSIGTLEVGNGGTIENGTIVTGTATLHSSSGVLSNDVIVGPLDIAASTELLVLNTLTVETAAGHLPGTINIGDNAVLDAENIVTLDHAVINLGAAGGGAVLEHDQRGSGGTLALGSGVTLNVIGTGDSIIEDGGSTIANHGTINVTAGAQVQIFGGAQFINTGEIDIGAGGVLTESTPFLNTGTLHVNGGTLNLNGAVSGMIDLSGGLLGGSAITLSGTRGRNYRQWHVSSVNRK